MHSIRGQIGGSYALLRLVEYHCTYRPVVLDSRRRAGRKRSVAWRGTALPPS